MTFAHGKDRNSIESSEMHGKRKRKSGWPETLNSYLGRATIPGQNMTHTAQIEIRAVRIPICVRASYFEFERDGGTSADVAVVVLIP